MKEEISAHIHDPEALEKLFRQDPALFTRSFADIAGDYDSDLVRFWKIRIRNENEGARERRSEGERVRGREGEIWIELRVMRSWMCIRWRLRRR